jgi:large subunit ribosomal protein L4
MPKIDIFTIEAKKKAKINLPEEIFETEVKPTLLAQAVRVFLANQRRAKAKVKTRGEVKGSGRKIWRQKGTGRARHGDRYAPIFVGGGIAHGPTGQENYTLKMSKKMKKKAFFGALTAKFKANEIVLVEGLEKIKPKTKEISQVLKKLAGKEKKILIISPGVVENISRAAKNLKGVQLAQASLLNTYQVLNGGKLVFMTESLPVLEKTFLAKKSPTGKTVEKKKINKKTKTKR